MSIVIYHNPACGTSRRTLDMIHQSGEEPEIVEYLKTPPTAERLTELLAAMGKSPREILRTNVAAYTELQIATSDLSDTELIALMVAHPSLINRPIVVTPRGVRLSRPAELVLEILPDRESGAGS